VSHACPWWFGYFLLNPLRWLVQPPARLLGPLVFYVVHELREPAAFFAEAAAALKPDGAVLLVEPPLHVSRAEFEMSLGIAERAGLAVTRPPRIGPNKAARLSKTRAG